MRYIFLLLVFLALSVTQSATLEAQDLKSSEQRVYERYRAFQQIDSLAGNGVILFRLQTSTNSIKALEQSGRVKKVHRVKERRQRKNDRIIKKFRRKFSFCPVYFFSSDDIDTVIAGNYEGVLSDGSGIKIDSLPSAYTMPCIGSFSKFGIMQRPHARQLRSPADTEITRRQINCYNILSSKQEPHFWNPLPMYNVSIYRWNKKLRKFHLKSKNELTSARKRRLDQALLKLGETRTE